MAFKRTTKVLSETAMSSMTDLVFLLLILFLITSTLVNPNALKLLLPKSTGRFPPSLQSPSRSRIGAMTPTPTILTEARTPVQYSELEDDLVDLLQTEEDPTFSIYSDESVPIKEVVSLMNIAKRNHYKVILATQPE